MTTTPIRIRYVARDPSLGSVGFAPYLPVTLAAGTKAFDLTGLLDTGSALNILPYTAGIGFGLDWNRQPKIGPLGGSLAGVDARWVILTGTVAPFPPVLLAFAWVHTDNGPVILGQTNFFPSFDVCFFRTGLEFDIRPAARPVP